MKKLLLAVSISIIMISQISSQNNNLSVISEPEIFDSIPAENENETFSEEELVIPEDFSLNDIFENQYNPSRSSTLKIFENIEIIYPGANWIFVGVTDNTKDIVFVSKNESEKETKFILQAKNSGNKILHFYKKDFVKNQLLDDYIEVKIIEELGSEKTIIKADPFYIAMPELDDSVLDADADIIESIILDIEKKAAPKQNKPESKVLEKKQELPVKKAVKAESKKEETKTAPTDTKTIENKNKTETQPAPEEKKSAVPQINTEDILKDAIKFYNNKAYKEAYEKIQIYLNNTTRNFDAGYYYKGKILEEPSEVQNISEALSSYQLILKNHPTSKYWDDANKRAVYLKKFYLEAR